MSEPDPGTPISDRMQSLLEQAAEDQAGEQRQLSDALAELRSQLTQLSADVAGVRAELDRDNGMDTAVGAVSTEVREAVQVIGERLDGLARMVHQRGLDIAELRGSVGELRTSVVAHGDALNGLTGGMDSLPSYGDRVGALQEAVTALADRLSGIDDLRVAMADVDSRVGATSDTIIELRRGFDDLRVRIGGLAAADDLDNTSSQLDSLGQQIEALRAMTTPLSEGVASLQESLRLETDRNSRLSEQIAELHDQIEATATTAGEVRGGDEGLTQRLDELQQDITAIGGNVAGLVESGVDPEELVDALRAARAAAEQGQHISEIAEQVADVRAALVGDGGLEGQVAALADRISRVDQSSLDEWSVDERISSTVSAAVAASEQRLTEHLDSAMMALAEVLLRRRPGRVTTGLGRARAASVFGGEQPEAPAAVDVGDGESDALAASAETAEAAPWSPDGSDIVDELDETAAPWDVEQDAELSALETQADDDEAVEADEVSGGVDEDLESEDDEASTVTQDEFAEPVAASESSVPEPSVSEPMAPPAEPEGEEGKRKRRPWWRPGD